MDLFKLELNVPLKLEKNVNIHGLESVPLSFRRSKKPDPVKKKNLLKLLILDVEKLSKEEDVLKVKMLKTVFSLISKLRESNIVLGHLKSIKFHPITFALIKEDFLNVQDILSLTKMIVMLNVSVLVPKKELTLNVSLTRVLKDTITCTLEYI